MKQISLFYAENVLKMRKMRKSANYADPHHRILSDALIKKKHSKQNELTPRQTEKIEAAKQTLKIYGAGYVSHFKPAFV